MTDKDSSALETSGSPGGAGSAAWGQRLRGLLEWMTRRQALSAAQTRRPPRDAASLQRAKAAIAIAERALDPAHPLREGSAAPLALSLYREATYWLLRSIHARPFTRPSLEAAFAESSAPLRLLVAHEDHKLDELRRVIVEQSFIDAGEGGAERQDQETRDAREFVGALLLAAQEPTAEIRSLLRQRHVRVLAALFAATALFVASNSALESAMRTPDLAMGKPWRTSSSLADCKPAEHACAGSQTDILFHTAEEKGPWFELDLGAPTEFSKVVLVNRSDCCSERAFPVAIEVSSDAQAWTQVAQRSKAYGTWTATFSTTRARYVRVHSLKKTYLHLERVEVHAR
jgi:F5/8 type C domain